MGIGSFRRTLRGPSGGSSSVRIYLDGTQLAERDPSKVFNELAETPKSYQIDGRMLRTAPRTFQHPGSSARTTILSSENTEAAAAFKRSFEARFSVVSQFGIYGD